MSVTVRIEHDGGAFGRTIRIARVKSAPAPLGGNEWDARHTYEATLTGGARTTVAHFKHRFGDPLHRLFAEAVAALEAEPEMRDRPLFGGSRERRGGAA